MMQALGFMSATHQVVPQGLLHVRHLQRWFASLHLDVRKYKRRLVTVPPSVQDVVCFWGSPPTSVIGNPTETGFIIYEVFTDVSLLGLGGTCLGRAVEVHGCPESQHINILDLQAV